MHIYKIHLSTLSLAPQLKGSIFINGKELYLPLNKQDVISAILKAFPILSFTKVLSSSYKVHNKRQIFDFTISSRRNLGEIIVDGINPDFVYLKTEVETYVK